MKAYKKKLNIVRTDIHDKIIHFSFDSAADLTSTLLRPQEFYESQEFAGKTFSHEEIFMWYVLNDKNYNFTYFGDWAGFNFPRKVLRPFFEKKFDPLWCREKQFLSLVKKDYDNKDNFYIIATLQKAPFDLEKGRAYRVLKHELSHAFYSIFPYYKKETSEIIASIKENKPEIYDTVIDVLLNMKYNESVLVDEFVAYMICSGYRIFDFIERSLGEEVPQKMKSQKNINFFNKIQNEINGIFAQTCKDNNIDEFYSR